MNRRLRWMSLASLLLHLVFLWFLPRPNFRTPAETEVKSVRLRFEKTKSDRRPEKRRSEPVAETNERVTQPSASRNQESENGNNQNDQESVEEPESSRENPSPPESESEQSPSDGVSQETSDGPDPTIQRSKAVTPEPDATETKDSTETSKPQQDYELLRRDNRFRSRTGDSSSDGTSRTTNGANQTVVDEAIDPYQVVEPRDETRDSESDTRRKIVIREPDSTVDDTTHISAPVMTIAETEAEAPPLQPIADGTPRESKPRQSDRRVLQNPLPEAPEWLEKTGRDVRVILQYVIDPDGNVVNVTVTNSSGFPELDSLVTRKLKRWKFEPGDRSERRLIVFRFNLTQDDE